MFRVNVVGSLIVAGLLVLSAEGQHPVNGGNAPQVHLQKNAGPKAPPRMGAWLRAHKDLPLDQQEKALEKDPDFTRRSPQVQARLKERLIWFNGLPPAKKEQALRNMEFWDKLNQEQRKQVNEAHQHMLTLPPERKVMVRHALRHLREMSPTERQVEFQSDKFKTTFSDQEQTILKNLAEISPVESSTPR